MNIDNKINKNMVFQDPFSGEWHCATKYITKEKEIGYRMDPTGYATKEEAIEAFWQQESIFETNMNIHKVAQEGRPTFKNELLKWYHEIFIVQASSSYEMVNAYVLYHFVLPNLGNNGEKLLTRVVATDINKLLRTINNICDTSGAQTYKFLKLFFRYAYEEGKIREDLYERVTPYHFKSDQIDFPVYTKEQLKTLLRRARDSNHFLEVLLLLLGLRIGEIRGLRFEHFNEQECTLRIKIQVVVNRRISYVNEEVKVLKMGNEIKPPKTQSSERLLRVPKIIFTALNERREYIDVIMKHRDENGLSWNHSLDGFICISEYGQLKSEGTINTALKRMCVSAQLPIISTHDLRHIASTQMLACAVENIKTITPEDEPIQKVADYLGHSNSTTTFSIYMSYVKEMSHVREVLDKNVDPFLLALTDTKQGGWNDETD